MLGKQIGEDDDISNKKIGLKERNKFKEKEFETNKNNKYDEIFSNSF
jgi:hypothetical protein